MEYIKALILGIVEGLTEFLPISSTGHLIIIGDLINFESPGFLFEVVIQLGAIFAICWLYRERLFKIIFSLKKESSQRFCFNLIIAFLPSAILGLLFHSYIKEYLFSPKVVAINLIIGGVLIIIIENIVKKVKFKKVEDLDYSTSLKIGFFQSIAMIPGTSRSGATIMGSLLVGLDRKSAAEFSFFLAIPTMFAASIYDIYKNYDIITIDDVNLILIGFITSFITALFLVKSLINFISNHGFKIFAYYRIIFGILMILYV